MGTIWPHEPVMNEKLGTGKSMLRTTFASSRVMRACALGLATISAVTILATSAADARRHHRHARHHHVRHHSGGDSYSPAFSSIIVDANSGATLSASNPDALRHPASLTKIMTLYLLFERLQAGKLSLDSEMQVSEHASDQAPTKLGLRPGQTIRVEDAIKGLVTRSANDAAVVIAETIGGEEDDFAQMMTRKARALGMSRTIYRNASGLPNDEQVTTARDQATLGRAIQDRFPRYYRYFSTLTFNYHGQSIRNHNHLLGNVEGVDGIKTGYTRASGFNLVTSLRRDNHHLVGVVMGGRSGGSRDAIMRNLLAENLDKSANRRTVAAITERNGEAATTDVADAGASAKTGTKTGTKSDDADEDSAETETSAPASAPPASAARSARSVIAAAAAAVPPQGKPEAKAESRVEPAPLTNGVIESQPLALVPGSTEPMKPVKVRTVQVKAGAVKLASAGNGAVASPFTTSAIPAARTEIPETSNAVVANAANDRVVAARAELPPQPANHGTGNGILGVLPASGASPASASQAMAYAEPVRPAAQNNPAKTMVTHSGWIVQVGALESESEARRRIDAARNQARGLLTRADSFTETVAKGDKTLYRARFAGLEKDQAEAVCRTLKRSDISCITVRN